jgi:catalase-peroxidase
MIVLGGAAAIEKAASDAGHSVTVPFKPGRTDATQEQTDIQSFALLEPKADGFRNYYGKGARLSPADALVDRADVLNLTVPEMTVLVGGMRALGTNTDGTSNGVFTARPGTLSNDFFVNLLDMSTVWEKSSGAEGLYVGKDRASGKDKWTATTVDLVFGSNSELRAVAEVYAADNAQDKFVNDFVLAWTKVMQNDRFDLM